MTSLRRTTWTPLGRPVAGELIRGESGPVVPISLGLGEDLHISDSTWARDLVAAASVAASVLESEDGLPAPAEPPPADALMKERDAYRDVLSRLVGAERPSELWPAIRDARLALDDWAGRP